MAKKINYGFFILILILIVLPVGSWYYLRKGTHYRLELLNDLKDFGTFPAFSFKDTKGKMVAKEDLKKKILVANFFSAQEAESNRQKGDMLVKLHEQFDDRKDVIFLTFVPDTPADIQALKDYLSTYPTLEEEEQCKYLLVEESEFKSLGAQVLKTDASAVVGNTSIAVADLEHTIKRQYDMTVPADVSRCVEHLAILLPVVKKKRSPKTK